MLLNTTKNKLKKKNNIMNSGNFSLYLINGGEDMVSDAKALDCGCKAILFWWNICHYITSSQMLLKDRGFHS